ncbi:MULTISPECIES: hypothetical protein [Burkholderia]|uniref:hypothetical protein n=1 Tax=Burkholderia TaxID=32008 RepID=UPI00157AC275|nr:MULTISPECIES: hypothetical protein [Burkholderia]
MTPHASPVGRNALLQPFLRDIGVRCGRMHVLPDLRKEMESADIQTYNAGVVSGVPI